jgi:hypothetical protein
VKLRGLAPFFVTKADEGEDQDALNEDEYDGGNRERDVPQDIGGPGELAARFERGLRDVVGACTCCRNQKH